MSKRTPEPELQMVCRDALRLGAVAACTMADEHLIILPAEDDDGHASLIQRYLMRAGVVNRKP